MKHFILLLSVLCVVFSCTDLSLEYKKAKNKALSSGIKVDTIMLGICFGDNFNKVKNKINNSGHALLGELYYSFPHSKIKDMNWKWNKAFAFHNDSLIEFKIISEDYNYNALDVLKEIYSVKYGELVEYDNAMYWFNGNLEIRINKIDPIDVYNGKKYEIRYYNMVNSKDGKRVKLDEVQLLNSYSLDYWEKHIKPKEDEAMKESIEDI